MIYEMIVVDLWTTRQWGKFETNKNGSWFCLEISLAALLIIYDMTIAIVWTTKQLTKIEFNKKACWHNL